MTCPFLKEAQVRYCQTSSVRKLIPIAAAGRADEKCSSLDHLTCPVYRMQPPQSPTGDQCPYLASSLMQYCDAAPVAKMIPYSESQLSRCGCDRFRYCELYLSLATPGKPRDEVDGIALPEWLSYTANHMWLDVGEDGVCHAGIDAFLSRALGTAERITYLWQRGERRATAIVTVNGVDFEIVFPNPFLLTSCNLYLRADPSRLTTAPYTGGWLFEGVPSPETSDNLLKGAAARQWMETEQHRVNEFLQQQPAPGGPLAADGGLFAPNLSRYLDSDQMRALFHTFFFTLCDARAARKSHTVKFRGTIVFLAGVLVALGAGWAGFPRVIHQTRRQPVDFSHQVHADKAGSKCDDCHAFLPDGRFAGVPKLDKCSACHAALMGTTPAEKLFVDNYVTPNREPAWLVYARQPENVYFSHITHVKTGNLKCEKCHGDHGTTNNLRPYQEDRISGYPRDIWGTTTRPAMTMDACVACHRQSHLEHSCLDCHK